MIKGRFFEYKPLFDLEKHFTIVWKFTSVCEWSCSYCNPRYNDTQLPKIVDTNIINFFIRIWNELKSDILVDITGGDVKEKIMSFLLLDQALPENMHLKIQTNFSFNNSILKKLSFRRNYIFCISYHFEYWNVLDFISKMDELINYNVYVLLKLPVTTKNTKEVQTIFEYFKKKENKHFKVVLFPILYNNIIDYNNRELYQLDTNKCVLVDKQMSINLYEYYSIFKSKQCSCNALKDRIFLYEDHIYPCQEYIIKRNFFCHMKDLTLSNLNGHICAIPFCWNFDYNKIVIRK